MIPEDIQREFLTGLRTFEEIMEKLEIIINELMADDGPEPKDLGNVGKHNARTTQSDQDASNVMSNDDACDRVERTPSWRRSMQERIKRSRDVVSRKRS